MLANNGMLLWVNCKKAKLDLTTSSQLGSFTSRVQHKAATDPVLLGSNVAGVSKILCQVLYLVQSPQEALYGAAVEDPDHLRWQLKFLRRLRS